MTRRTHYFITATGWKGVLIGAIAFGAARQACLGADAELRDIMENVRANEALYENCDVLLTYEERLLGPPRRTSGSLRDRTERTAETRYVLQEGMSRMEVEEVYKLAGVPGRRQSERLSLYDGVFSRALQGSVANIVEGPIVDEHIVRPHMMLVQLASYPVPLSTYLQGEKALAAYPGEIWTDRNRRIEVEYLGDEQWSGHPCHKLVCRHISKPDGEVRSTRVLWLASDRNYIPIRFEAYSYMWSEDLPLHAGVVEEFIEVEDGVWFPSVATITVYDNRILKAENRQVPAWEHGYTVQKVSLDPSFPPAFFRDLVIPEGTAVYEIENGEIIGSYRQGSPTAPGGPAADARGR